MCQNLRIGASPEAGNEEFITGPASNEITNAHLFLDYLMRPEVIAPISNLLRYANANQASLPLLDPALLSDPAAYPRIEEHPEWQAGVIYEPKLERLRTRAWSRVKTGL